MKMIRILAIACFVCVWELEPTSAQQPAPTPPVEQLYRMPVVYSVPGMDKAEVRRDIVYKTVDTDKGKTDLKLDLYSPAEATSGKRYPLVILISGGGIEAAPYDWRDAGFYQSYGRLLAASGLAAISYSKRYARGPLGTSHGGDDTRDLITYVREHADELHIDKERIALSAFSAGGLMLAPFFHEPPAYIRALACSYCVSDVTQDSWAGLAGVTPEQVELAASKFSSANVIHAADRVPTPLFVARAGLDSPGLNRTIGRLIQEALLKNMSVEVWNHANGRHGFDILDDNARSKEIVQRAIEFLRTNLNSKL